MRLHTVGREGDHACNWEEIIKKYLWEYFSNIIVGKANDLATGKGGPRKEIFYHNEKINQHSIKIQHKYNLSIRDNKMSYIL